MQAIGVEEQCRVPIHIENIEEIQNGRIIDPEYAVVELLGQLWIVVEQLL